jgi:hypothetical protein
LGKSRCQDGGACSARPRGNNSKYVTPLLHCEIGIGNDLFTMLRNIINEHIETYAPGEEAIRRAIPAPNSCSILDRSKLKALQDFRKRTFADKLQKARQTLADQQSKHGGSLNGKDIKKVMNNASHIFDQLAAILKEGKRKDCLLSDDDIGLLCLHFREVRGLYWPHCKAL